MMVGRWVSFWDWLFLGAMLNFRGVSFLFFWGALSVAFLWEKPSKSDILLGGEGGWISAWTVGMDSTPPRIWQIGTWTNLWFPSVGENLRDSFSGLIFSGEPCFCLVSKPLGLRLETISAEKPDTFWRQQLPTVGWSQVVKYGKGDSAKFHIWYTPWKLSIASLQLKYDKKYDHAKRKPDRFPVCFFQELLLMEEILHQLRLVVYPHYL